MNFGEQFSPSLMCAWTTPGGRVGTQCCVRESLRPRCPLTHVLRGRLGPSHTRSVPQLHRWQREAGSPSTHPLLADLHVEVSVFRSHKSCRITSRASPCS